MNTKTVLSILICTLPVTALAERPASKTGDWSIETGIGAMYAPDYEGSDDYEVSPVPLVELNWRDKIKLTTLGGPALIATPFANEDFSVDFGVGYEFGRDEKDNDALRGLGNMDVGVVAMARFSYETGPVDTSLEISRDLGGDRDGMTATLEAEYGMPVLNNKARLSLSPHLTWASEKYMSNSFGITAVQASRSTKGYGVYEAGSGFKDAGVTVGLGYQVSDNIVAMGRLNYTRLMGDAIDSPLVKDQGSENQLMAAIGLVYSW